MGVEIYGGGQFNPDADLDVRIQEDFSGTMVWNGVNTTPDQIKSGSRQDGTHSILGGTGGGTLAGGAQVAGRRILQGSSAAGVVFRRGSTAAAFAFPLSQDFSPPNGYAGRRRPAPRRSRRKPARSTNLRRAWLNKLPSLRKSLRSVSISHPLKMERAAGRPSKRR